MPNKANNNKLITIFAAIALVASIWHLSYHFGQKDFFSFWPFYGLSFLGWAILFKSPLSGRQIFLIGLLTRLGLLMAFPALSDDIYRFFWDGSLAYHGISPYGILPSEAVKLNVEGLNESLYQLLNSPQYFTIYPPISQLYFVISKWVGQDIVHTVIVMKILFLITESSGYLFMLKLVKKFGYKPSTLALWFLNPLVIIEGIGNLHYEVVMISFICISLYYIFNNKLIYGSFFFAFSIGVKLLPLMLLPYFWFHLKGRSKWIFFGTLSTFLMIIFIPVFGSIQLSTFMRSIDLYFRSFEFNASIYYVLRYIGMEITSYNLIKYLGPVLGLTTIITVFWWAKRAKNFSFPVFIHFGVVAWTCYLILATTVHPWYVITIVWLASFSRYKLVLTWSFLIFISYINYSYTVYYENMYWIGLEYVLLFTCIGYELWSSRFLKNIRY